MSGHIQTMHAPLPGFTAEDATWITWQKYRIQTMARPLAGERDLNFRLTDANRRDYLLKIWNSTQDPAAARFQLAAIAHIAATDADLPIARVIPCLDGTDYLSLKDNDGTSHPACMLSWLDGLFLREATPSRALKQGLGRALARLDLALAGFRHPAQERDLLWDICKVHRLRGMAEDIQGGALNSLVNRAFDELEASTLPKLAGLRKQVIHNDFNPDNVLVDPAGQVTVTGIIDFGDVLHAPLICELAVACAYQLSGVDDPVDDILPMVAAYHELLPLENRELDLLIDLVRARLLCTLIITTRMATLHPENREYLLADNPAAAGKLAQLDILPREAALLKIRAVCAPGPTGRE